MGLLPVVFGVRLPDAYHNWMSFLDAFQVAEWSNLVIPDSCLSGGFRGRLVIDALAPFALMLALAVAGKTLGDRANTSGDPIRTQCAQAAQRLDLRRL